MADRSIGFIEAFGLAAAVAAADAAVKSANVKLIGYEYTKGDGMCTVKVEGNVGAVKAAIAAGKRTAELVNGPLSGTKSVVLMARPADGIKDILIYNKENVGGEIALATGKRPTGSGHKPVLVKNWKPKEEPKVETPIEKAPEPPVVEEVKEESPVIEDKEPVVTEPEVKVEEPVEEAKEAEEPVEEAPKAEEPVEAPKAEESVKEETKTEEPAKAEEPVEEAPEAEEATEDKSEDAASAPKKSTSTGSRRSRSRKRKSTDKTTD